MSDELTVEYLFRNQERGKRVFTLSELDMSESDLNDMEDYKQPLLDLLTRLTCAPTLESFELKLNQFLQDNDLPSVGFSIDEKYALCGFSGVSVVTDSTIAGKSIVANISGGHGVIIIDFDPYTKTIEGVRVPDDEDSNYLRECADQFIPTQNLDPEKPTKVLFIDGKLRQVDSFCLEDSQLSTKSK